MDFPSPVRHVVKTAESLAPYTWLRIGGEAEYFAEPTSEAQLQELVQHSKRAGLDVKILGGGSNLLVNSEGVKGLILDLSAPAFGQIEVKGNTLICGAGAKLSQAITHSVGAGLGGLEHLVGIPGTLGGALHGNAATLDGDIGQRVLNARLMTRTGEVVTLNRQQLQFSHHKSSLDELVTLEVTFELEPADVRQLTQKMQTVWIVKRAHQPPLQTAAVIPFVEPDVLTAGIVGASWYAWCHGGERTSQQYPSQFLD